MHALLSARKRAGDQDGELVLVLTSVTVLRLLALTGADRLIPNFATLDEALAYAADVTVLAGASRNVSWELGHRVISMTR